MTHHISTMLVEHVHTVNFKKDIPETSEVLPESPSPFSGIVRFMRSVVEPYRSLFGLGAIHALVGAMVWLLNSMDWIENPILIHPLMMSGGFLLSFATGFLWTAFPRFTRSNTVRVLELAPLVASNVASLVAELMMNETWAMVFYLASMVWTDVFLIRRYRLRSQNPPDSFVFVGVGACIGTISIVVLTLSHWIEFPISLLLFSRSFFLKGYILFMIFGVGFRLIAAIMGVRKPQGIDLLRDVHSMTSGIVKHHRQLWVYGVLMAIAVAAFIMESLGAIRLSAILFSSVFSWIGFGEFHVHRLPDFKDRLAVLTWVSMINIVLAPLLIAVFPEHAVHLWHLAFIGGIGLVTLLVSIRVSVSHSGFAVSNVEERKGFIPWMSVLILLAALTRMSVSWWPETQQSHYVYAAVLWIAAMLIWLRYALRYSIIAEYRRWMAVRKSNV